nr:inactive peptidyl-prolyl cis-trans isomerase shutdown [Leptinotarsa decemlineata]XP_023027884.1 inactive peptidyl-prolyl cis-trans isomerase shutdown [Leptinotarsa decemlineata]
MSEILNEPIKLKDLMEDGVEFTVKSEAVDGVEEETDEDREYKKNLLDFMNMQVVGGDYQDEDTYIEGQPFENIASKMFNIVENGAIKKRIIREGYGDKPPDLSSVRVHYNGYIEFNAEPFDSTYARKKSHQFTVNSGEVIPGLDIAVQSMKLNEKSQFLIQPQYAYGKLGCLNRVPANSEVLFEVELLEIVDVGAASAYESLPPEDQRSFVNLYGYCLALCAKGNDLYGKNVKAAIREYNTAAGKLEMCQLSDYDDQIKQQELLMRLYTNLLICYTKVEEPKKGCINFNKIRELVNGTDLTISAKCYYNNAKCLRMLGEFNLAKKRLDLAYKLEPKNPDILNEMVNLENEIKTYKKKQIELGKALLNSAK